MVIQPRDDIYEPLSVFRSPPFCPRFTPQNRVAGRAAGLLVLARVPRARRSGCSEVLPLHMPSHQRGCPASTVARRHCAPRVSARRRPKPRRAAILAAMRMDGWEIPFGAIPQSVDGGRRSQYAQPNHSQPACKLQVRADGRDCPYRQAWLSACPHWQAQQARRPSTQSPKHLAAQPSSASERQDKEAACGPHPGMDSIAYRWYRSGEGHVFARPVLHRKSVRGTI